MKKVVTMVNKICEGDKTFGVTSEDFEQLKSMTISEVFDNFIKTRIN
jgi:hypothetical protein